MHDTHPNDICLDTAAIDRIMNAQEFGITKLAFALKKDPSEVRRWVKGKTKKITLKNAQDLAHVLDCNIKHLTGEEVFSKISLTTSEVPFGSPNYYINAIKGKWIANSTIYNSGESKGQENQGVRFDWDVEFMIVGGVLRGTCKCTTPQHEQAQYALELTVTGRGIILMDGVRDAGDGAEDVFRALLEYYSDTRTRTMKGGTVTFWPLQRQILLGYLTLTKLPEL